MKKHWLAILLCTPFFFTHSANAVSDADKIKARAYVFAAEDEFNNKNYESALTGLEKAEQIMGEKIAPILVLEIKTRYELAQYEQVKELLEKFFTVQSTSAMQKEVSPYLIKNEEKLAEAEAQAEAARLKIEEARRSVVKSILDSMVTIPAGSFMMGCSSGDSECDANEKPRHNVNINSFSLMATEVTRGQFAAFVDATGYITDTEKKAGGKSGCYSWNGLEFTWYWSANWLNAGFKGLTQSDNHPVLCVSYNDTMAFTTWLNEQPDVTFRLPSEAEWEFAARAGSNTKYLSGNDASSLCRHGNVVDNTPHPIGKWVSKDLECQDGNVFTASVGQYPSNAFGLHDMSGNVEEWTADYWNDSYSGAPTDGSTWLSGNGSKRVLRGGAWNTNLKYARASSRSPGSMSGRYAWVGFRLARD